MKLSMVLGVLVGLTGSCYGQEAAKEYPKIRDYEHRFKITQEYDKFEDDTKLELYYGQVYEARGYTLSLFVIRHSKGLQGTKGNVSFYFLGRSVDGWKYLKYHDVVFLVDGERWAYDPDHDGDVGSPFLLEHIFVRLSEERLLKLANATRASVKIGSDVIEFDDSKIQGLKDFASLIANPDAPIIDRTAPQATASRKRAIVDKKVPATPGDKASAKLGIAKSHEKDKRTKLAIQAYKDLVKDYPGSPQAEEAERRLEVLIPKP